MFVHNIFYFKFVNFTLRMTQMIIIYYIPTRIDANTIIEYEHPGIVNDLKKYILA